MKILYIGDIMGRAGRNTIAEVLPDLKQTHQPDLIIAQAENVSHGKGISPAHMRELQQVGVDFFSGGNHSLEKPASHAIFNSKSEPIIRPANMLGDLPGEGYRIAQTAKGPVLVISLLGTTFPGTMKIANPLKVIDKILVEKQSDDLAATVVNFHGDLSSQKKMIGHYLDGRVTIVVGDHWHIPTADASVLPKGTAHISDVGMCGSVHSSLGVTYEATIPAWKADKRRKDDMALDKPYQFNAILVETEANLAKSIKPIQMIVN